MDNFEDFEDHCWRDVISSDVIELYRPYRRKVKIGPRPALLLIDLYNLAYEGGSRPISEISGQYPSSCGKPAWDAIPPTQRLIAAARARDIPIFYSTGLLPVPGGAQAFNATQRSGRAPTAADFAIHETMAPAAGDVLIAKERASAFFGTLLTAHLARRGIQSLIVAGESTSGCVRASVVDAYSHGYHVSVVEECCFDRCELSHKVNLFDLHHKYADVMHVDYVLKEMAGISANRS
jgi:maleamate amidohydrolase